MMTDVKDLEYNHAVQKKINADDEESCVVKIIITVFKFSEKTVFSIVEVIETLNLLRYFIEWLRDSVNQMWVMSAWQ